MFIPDPQMPLFIPYGYRGIGKTMIIMRLIRFLYQNDYVVKPNLVFKEPSNQRYHNLCQRYIDAVFNTHALAATGVKDTILLDVISHKGNAICCIIDQAGEHQYDVDNPHLGISQEMYNIVKLPNPQIWGFMVENNNWLNQQLRQGYVQSIRNIASIALAPRDKALFIYNKVDLTPFVSDNGKVLWRGLFDSADSLYPGIFNSFERKNALLRILKGKYCFRMTPFQTGGFYETGGSTQFVMSRDEYPKQLWYNILKCIR